MNGKQDEKQGNSNDQAFQDLLKAVDVNDLEKIAEIMVVNAGGKPDMEAIQHWLRNGLTSAQQDDLVGMAASEGNYDLFRILNQAGIDITVSKAQRGVVCLAVEAVSDESSWSESSYASKTDKLLVQLLRGKKKEMDKVFSAGKRGMVVQLYKVLRTMVEHGCTFQAIRGNLVHKETTGQALNRLLPRAAAALGINGKPSDSPLTDLIEQWGERNEATKQAPMSSVEGKGTNPTGGEAGQEGAKSGKGEPKEGKSKSPGMRPW